MTLSEMLPANEIILKRRFPDAYIKIKQTANRAPFSFYYDETQKGPKLKIIHGEYSYSPYGSKDPSKIIERWFSNLKLIPESLYSLTGFGDGSHVRYLIENSGTGVNVLVAEKDPALLRETFARFDFSDILSNDRFLLGTGEPESNFFTPIQGAALTGVSDINSLIFSPLHKIDELYYDKVRNELVRQYLVIRPLMEVNVRTATNLQENTLRNLPHMINAPDVGELKDKFKDIPFILIGAGPSLDESIDFLKEVKNKAIIVASNTPYRKLINNGIRPHLVVTADPMRPTLSGFHNVNTEGVPLACPYSAYPEIVERFSGKILSWCTFNPIASFLKKQLGHKDGTVIMEQGTVSGCVLDLSKVFGCRKVLFVGQDMSVQDDGKYYTDDSFYADHGNHYVEKGKGQRLPGNTQDFVTVEQRLFVYLKTFEQFISQKNHDIEYRNLARTGAKIKGAPYITYSEALEWIGDTDSCIFDREINQLLDSRNEVVNLYNLFEPVRKYCDKILELCLSAAIETEMMPEKFSGMNYSENNKVKSLIKKGKEVNRLIDSDQLLWHVLLEGRTKRELVIYQRLLREIIFPNKNWQAIQGNKEYFWALIEGSYWLLNTLNKLISSKANTV